MPGATAPLCIAKIRIHRTCAACGKSNFVASDGGPAGGDEFQCWACQKQCAVCAGYFSATAGLLCGSDSHHFVCDSCLDG